MIRFERKNDFEVVVKQKCECGEMVESVVPVESLKREFCDDGEVF